MSLLITVLAQTRRQEERWMKELTDLARAWGEVEVSSGRDKREYGSLVFIDSKMDQVNEIVESLDRTGRAVFLVVKEGSKPPALLLEGNVDDVLVVPFREIEVLGKIRHYEQLLLWNEVKAMTQSFSVLLQNFQEDLKLAERLQKKRLPQRFQDIPGLLIASRYLAGLRSGGDFFDIAEDRENHQASIILSRSSSYGLSSSFLSVLMSIAVKLSLDPRNIPGKVKQKILKIQQELEIVLGQKESLSLFYGTFYQHESLLRYVNLGSAALFYSERPHEAKYELLSHQESPLRKGMDLTGIKESLVQLHPGGRLILLSQGFVESMGGEGAVLKLLNHLPLEEAKDVLNEFSFRTKSLLSQPDDLPAQDCTAIVFDVNSRILKLARGEI